MYLKAGLFVFIVFSCFVLVWVQAPTARTALLLLLMIWASVRASYFAFYVVGKYVERLAASLRTLGVLGQLPRPWMAGNPSRECGRTPP